MFSKYIVLVGISLLFICSGFIARTYNKRAHIKKSAASKFFKFIDKSITFLRLENKYNEFLKKLSIATGKISDKEFNTLKETYKRHIAFAILFNLAFLVIGTIILKTHFKGYMLYFLVCILFIALIIIELSIMYISYLSKRKCLDDQTVDLMEELLIEYKIHQNIVWAFQEAVKRLSGPMKKVIDIFIRHLKASKNLSKSISFLSETVQNKWIKILKVIVTLNYEKGGDMTSDLMFLSKLYQEDKSLKSQLKSMLVMFKITSIFLFIAFPIMYIVNAQYNEVAYELYFVNHKEILVITEVLSIIPLIVTNIYERKL